MRNFILAIFFNVVGMAFAYELGWRNHKIHAAHEITLYDVICDVEHGTIHIRTGNYLGFATDAIKFCPGMMPCPGTCTIQGASSTFTEEPAR